MDKSEAKAKQLQSWTAVAPGWAATGSSGSKTLVLEAATIEGKLKKPQVALINVDKRPQFRPIALTDLDAKKDALEKIDAEVFESVIYDRPFPVTSKIK